MSTDKAVLRSAEEPESDEPGITEAENEEPELEALDRLGVPSLVEVEIDEPEDDEAELEAIESQVVPEVQEVAIEEPEVAERRKDGF